MTRSNSIYINLKGRDPYGIVDPADKYELEEQIITDLYGYNDTSLSPIFLAAGPGIKENYRTDRYIREVDLAPTAAVLLGVDMPADCEGAPAYQIFSEKM